MFNTVPFLLSECPSHVLVRNERRKQQIFAVINRLLFEKPATKIAVEKVVETSGGRSSSRATLGIGGQICKIVMTSAPVVACLVDPKNPGDPKKRKEFMVEGAMRKVDMNMSSEHVPAHIEASALPISVTTASRPDPSVHSQLFNLQLATDFVTSPKQSHLSGVRKIFTPPPALAGPKGGFTLPSNSGLAKAALNASMSQPVAFVASIPASASASPPFRGYSAASRACINALDDKTSTGLVRRNASAPNVSPVGTSKNKSKYKYRKVVGGKIPTSKSMVSAA